MSHITNVQDPNFPLIQLPSQFRAQRQTVVDRQAAIGETKEVFRAQGPGCVRHIWIVPNPISDTPFYRGLYRQFQYQRYHQNLRR